MAGLKAYITLKVTDKHGKTISEKTEESKSFLIGFLGLLEGIFKGAAASSTVKDVLGVDEQFPDTTQSASGIMAISASDDFDTYGLIVGTGTTAPTNADYVIETKIDHGVGAGELDYGGTGWVSTAVVAPNVDLKMTRTFVNSSGNTITVQEVAIYASATETGATIKKVAIIRDLTGGVAVLDTQTLTVTYTFRTTV